MATNDEIIDADVDDYLKNPKGNLRYWEIDRVKNMMNQARQDEAIKIEKEYYWQPEDTKALRLAIVKEIKQELIELNRLGKYYNSKSESIEFDNKDWQTFWKSKGVE
jgi:hypothetical protein